MREETNMENRSSCCLYRIERRVLLEAKRRRDPLFYGKPGVSVQGRYRALTDSDVGAMQRVRPYDSERGYAERPTSTPAPASNCSGNAIADQVGRVQPHLRDSVCLGVCTWYADERAVPAHTSADSWDAAHASEAIDQLGIDVGVTSEIRCH